MLELGRGAVAAGSLLQDWLQSRSKKQLQGSSEEQKQAQQRSARQWNESSCECVSVTKASSNTGDSSSKQRL
jgi:hypothetical protein